MSGHYRTKEEITAERYAEELIESALCLRGTPPREERVSRATSAIVGLTAYEDYIKEALKGGGRNLSRSAHILGIHATAPLLVSMIEHDRPEFLAVEQSADAVGTLCTMYKNMAGDTRSPAGDGRLAELGVLNVALQGIASGVVGFEYATLLTSTNIPDKFRHDLRKVDVDLVVTVPGKGRIWVQIKKSEKKITPSAYAPGIAHVSAEKVALILAETEVDPKIAVSRLLKVGLSNLGTKAHFAENLRRELEQKRD